MGTTSFSTIEALAEELRQHEEIERCRKDWHYFIDNYLFILESKHEFGLGFKPFKLWPKQVELCSELDAALSENTYRVIEKSRDMGATYTVLAWIFWRWRFTPNFSALIGSRSQDQLDKKNEPDTIFQKLCTFLEQLPDWLWPKGMDRATYQGRQKTFLALKNPENNSTITGEAMTAKFGRSGRNTVVMLDEYAFWDEDVWSSVRHNSKVVFPVSSANGENHFYRLVQRAKERNKLITLNWYDSPQHTQAWYEDQKDNSDEEDFEREVLINYHAKVRGLIYPQIYDCPVSDQYEFVPEWETLCMWDWGSADDGVLLIAQRDPYTMNLYLLDEVVRTNVDVDWFAQFVPGIKIVANQFDNSPQEDEKIERIQKWHARDVYHYGDPSGGQRLAGRTKAVTPFSVLKGYGIKQIRCNGALWSNLAERRRYTRKLLKRLHVHSRCQYFLNSMKLYAVREQDEGSTTRNPQGIHKYSHAPSALEAYAITETDPTMIRAATGRKTYGRNPWRTVA